jgi:hypothetical protein
MSSVTGRFTNSPESAMEFDLARFRDVTDGAQFTSVLERICEVTLTSDYWSLTLPSELATSSSRSPSLFAYAAALVLLDARALFSKVRVSDLFDPALKAQRAAVERHHLFPKGHLKSIGVTGIRDTNQIANYAWVEWGDNAQISDQPPATYLPTVKERFEPDELGHMYWWHALPDDWEHMGYQEFLKQRRDRIAQVIAQGYRTLTGAPSAGSAGASLDLNKVIQTGESEYVEFKSTLRVNRHTGQADSRMELAILRTIAGFLNTSGGTLIVGLADDGTPLGVGVDGFPNEDKMSLHLVNMVRDRMGSHVMTDVHPHFEDYNGGRTMVIRCGKAVAPVYVKDGNVERFYVRTGPSSTELSMSETQEYIKKRFK